MASSNGQTTGTNALDLLNEVWAAEQYSLANYLADIRTADPEHAEFAEAVRRIAAERRQWADALGALLVARDSQVRPANYPVRFFAYNDVSVAALGDQLAEEAVRLADLAAGAAERLAADAEASELLQRIAEGERRHADQLRAPAVSP